MPNRSKPADASLLLVRCLHYFWCSCYPVTFLVSPIQSIWTKNRIIVLSEYTTFSPKSTDFPGDSKAKFRDQSTHYRTAVEVADLTRHDGICCSAAPGG